MPPVMTPAVTLVPTILAANDTDLLVKIAVFGVVAVIWAVSQAVGWLAGKKDKTLPPSRPRPPLTPGGNLPTRRPPPLQRRQNQKPVPQPSPAKSVPQKQTPRPAAMSVAVPALQTARVQERVQQGMTHAYDARPQRSDPQPPRGDVLPQRQVVAALLRQRNLRKAFVVTELLRPPLALRRDE